MNIIASREGYNGENILITDITDTQVYVEMGENKGWLTLSYKMVDDGTFNQSVQNIPLPYIVIGKDVYSIDSFHTWDQ